MKTLRNMKYEDRGRKAWMGGWVGGRCYMRDEGELKVWRWTQRGSGERQGCQNERVYDLFNTKSLTGRCEM